MTCITCKSVSTQRTTVGEKPQKRNQKHKPSKHLHKCLANRMNQPFSFQPELSDSKCIESNRAFVSLLSQTGNTDCSATDAHLVISSLHHAPAPCDARAQYHPSRRHSNHSDDRSLAAKKAIRFHCYDAARYFQQEVCAVKRSGKGQEL